MESLNKIKQPQPEIINNKKEKREIKKPNVGVVDVPNISKTPLYDTLEVKKEENPHIIYKLTKNTFLKNFDFYTITSLGIGACGIGSLLSLLKNLIKNKKH